MSGHFSLLAGYAFASPSSDVLTHRGPHDFGADGLTRPLDARVSKAVYRVEDGFSEGQWNEWPCGAIADVHNETCLANVDALEIQA